MVSFRMDRPRRLDRLGRATLRWAIAAYVLAMAGFACAAAASPTLTAVKARGSLVCGVNEGLPGFSNVDERGMWTGFDVDFCRAIAAAIFGDPKKLKLVPLSADARFQALRDGKIDVLARNSTWTMGRETEFGLTFVGATYYDGQGFMVPRALRVNSALQLDGAKVCVQSGTTTIDNLADFFSSNGMTLQEVVSTSADESIKNYDAGTLFGDIGPHGKFTMADYASGGSVDPSITGTLGCTAIPTRCRCSPPCSVRARAARWCTPCSRWRTRATTTCRCCTRPRAWRGSRCKTSSSVDRSSSARCVRQRSSSASMAASFIVAGSM